MVTKNISLPLSGGLDCYATVLLTPEGVLADITIERIVHKKTDLLAVYRQWDHAPPYVAAWMRQTSARAIEAVRATVLSFIDSPTGPYENYDFL